MKQNAEKTLEIKWLNPNDLIPYARNSKLHSPEQIEKIAQQITAFGFDQPIVVDKKKVIIKGHGRREAALILKLKKVPVFVSSMDENSAMAARIGDNKVAEAPWIHDMLRQDFTHLRDVGMGQMTGYDPDEFLSIISGWTPDPAGRAEPEGADPGLTGRITVTCRQMDKDKVMSCIESAIKASGLTDVLIS